MRNSTQIRILLVDDHTVVRAGYRRFLEQEPDCQVIAEASTGEEAYQLLQTIAPDIVILDLSMPGQGGLSVLRSIGWCAGDCNRSPRCRLHWPTCRPGTSKRACRASS